MMFSAAILWKIVFQDILFKENLNQIPLLNIPLRDRYTFSDNSHLNFDFHILFTLPVFILIVSLRFSGFWLGHFIQRRTQPWTGTSVNKTFGYLGSVTSNFLLALRISIKCHSVIKVDFNCPALFFWCPVPFFLVSKLMYKVVVLHKSSCLSTAVVVIWKQPGCRYEHK